MTSAAPMKYSPQDAQGARRRQREDAGSDEWIESLPTPRKEEDCLLYTSPSPRDVEESRMPSSA